MRRLTRNPCIDPRSAAWFNLPAIVRERLVRIGQPMRILLAAVPRPPPRRSIIWRPIEEFHPKAASFHRVFPGASSQQPLDQPTDRPMPCSYRPRTRRHLIGWRRRTRRYAQHFNGADYIAQCRREDAQGLLTCCSCDPFEGAILQIRSATIVLQLFHHAIP